MSDGSEKRRILFCGGILIVALIGLGSRLALLHLGDHGDELNRIKRSRSIRRTITVRRGNIYERGGRQNVLAMDMAVKDVCADPMKIAQEGQSKLVARVLSKYLDVPHETLTRRLANPERRFAYVKRFVPRQRANAVRDMRLTGVFMEDSRTRFYPQRGLLCHVLGFVNHAGVGSAGIEQCMDRYLKGSPGFVETEVNALREEVYLQRHRHIAGMEGADVFLTIDQNIQYLVESALDDLMTEHQPKGAWAIVQRVRTGEILAMASRPAYCANNMPESTPDSRLNRCIGVVYEPGSTFKALTIAAALNEGTVQTNTVFDCEHGAWFYGGHRLRDFHAYGMLTVADGLKKSSNILAAKVALTLGDRRLYRYLRDFGIGRAAGIELPAEENGILHSVDSWSKIAATRIAMGHGVAVTALQMINVFCAIANDGILMQPHVIREVRQKDGRVLYRGGPRESGRPIRPETAQTMRRLLARVTENGGTGRRARIAHYTIAGKTGTADKAVNGQYNGDATVARFVGFLPAKQPEVAIIVVADEPQPHHTGGRVAAPCFSRIAAGAVRYLQVPPDVPADERDPRRGAALASLGAH